MSEKTIKKSQLAQIVGCRPAYITKLVNKGVFDGCQEDDGLLRFESIEAYVESYDFKRDSQREANAKNKDESQLYITKKDLASAFALKSATEITRLDKKGVFDDCYVGKKLKRVAALKAYVDEINGVGEKSSSGNDGGEQNSTVDFNPQSVEDIRNFYKTLIALAKSPVQKATIAKEEDIKIEKFLKNQEMQKNLVDINIVKKEAFEMARKVRDSFLALPDRLASDLVEKTQLEIHQTLTKEVNYLLEALSDA